MALLAVPHNMKPYSFRNLSSTLQRAIHNLLAFVVFFTLPLLIALLTAVIHLPHNGHYGIGYYWHYGYTNSLFAFPARIDRGMRNHFHCRSQLLDHLCDHLHRIVYLTLVVVIVLGLHGLFVRFMYRTKGVFGLGVDGVQF